MAFTLTPVTVIARNPTNIHDQFMQLSPKLAQKLQLNHTGKIKIRLGKTAVDVDVQTTDMSATEILIPETILKNLSLPVNRHKLHAFYQLDIHTLILGPIIGLLTDFPAEDNRQPNFRTIHAFCEELHQRIRQTGGFFYVFRYDQFSVQGYYLENDNWIPAPLPLPDVIYNRIHSRRLEYTKSFMRFRNRLEQLEIPLFNDRFLSKWDVYALVKEDAQLLSSIPETKIFSKENLFELTQKYETVFIKPVHGSQGRNIIKVTREQADRYSFQISTNERPAHPEGHFSLSKLYQGIKPWLQNRIWIVQQGIQFLSHEERPLDFRVLCHKNGGNRWEITSIVARIGGNKEFVANLARGGITMKPLKALRAGMTNEQAFDTFTQMKELSLEVAETVSQSCNGITGELGIDIGVDHDRKPWLIEVNSKPSKVFEDDLGKIRPSAKAIIQFCTMLAFDSIDVKEE